MAKLYASEGHFVGSEPNAELEGDVIALEPFSLTRWRDFPSQLGETIGNKVEYPLFVGRNTDADARPVLPGLRRGVMPLKRSLTLQ